MNRSLISQALTLSALCFFSCVITQAALTQPEQTFVSSPAILRAAPIQGAAPVLNFAPTMPTTASAIATNLVNASTTQNIINTLPTPRNTANDTLIRNALASANITDAVLAKVLSLLNTDTTSTATINALAPATKRTNAQAIITAANTLVAAQTAAAITSALLTANTANDARITAALSLNSITPEKLVSLLLLSESNTATYTRLRTLTPPAKLAAAENTITTTVNTIANNLIAAQTETAITSALPAPRNAVNDSYIKKALALDSITGDILLKILQKITPGNSVLNTFKELAPSTKYSQATNTTAVKKYTLASKVSTSSLIDIPHTAQGLSNADIQQALTGLTQAQLHSILGDTSTGISIQTFFRTHAPQQTVEKVDITIINTIIQSLTPSSILDAFLPLTGIADAHLQKAVASISTEKTAILLKIQRFRDPQKTNVILRKLISYIPGNTQEEALWQIAESDGLGIQQTLESSSSTTQTRVDALSKEGATEVPKKVISAIAKMLVNGTDTIIKNIKRLLSEGSGAQGVTNIIQTLAFIGNDTTPRFSAVKTNAQTIYTHFTSACPHNLPTTNCPYKNITF